jgi:hypothetical protein
MVLCARDADAIFSAFRGANVNGNPTLPAANDPNYAYLTAANWAALGQVRCDDLFICKGDNCYYGLLLQCTAAFGPFVAGDYLAAIRGTMEPIEWVNDAMAEDAIVVPGVTGAIGDGFWQVYASMTFADMDGTNVRQDAPSVIAAIVNATADRLFVVGHSLGAVLAGYMTANFNRSVAAADTRLAPYFFAQPRMGTQDFVDNYRATNPRYALANYVSDIVPNLPSSPPFEALGAGTAQQNTYVIPRGLPGMPPFSLTNNHSCVAYARMLDPTNVLAQRLPL